MRLNKKKLLIVALLVALAVSGQRGGVTVEDVRALTLTTYRAARAAWLVVAQPDPEP